MSQTKSSFQIHWMFWLLCAAVGADGILNPDTSLIIALIWIPAIIVSVIVHEFAHRIALRTQGATSCQTLLWGLGGRTRGPGQFSAMQHVTIALSGPITSFVLAGIFYLAGLITLPETASPLIKDSFEVMMNANLILGGLHLLPVLPLDGGQILRSIFGGQMPLVVLIITLILCTLLAVFGLVSSRLMMPFVFVQLIWFNIGLLRSRSAKQ